MRAQTRTKSLFVNGSSLHLKLLLCLGASLIFLAVENRGDQTLQRNLFAAMVEPVRQAVSAPARMLRWFSELSASHFELVAENQRLREESLLLRGKQLKFEALQQENTRLRGLLDTTFKVGDQVLIAEPLSINVVPYENLIVVDKGSRYGIRTGQAVVDGNGLVGQVLRVAPHTADVVMITDPSHAVPVQVNRNGLRTIAMGTGQIDRLELPYLTSSADVHAGDLLVTSGLGGVFPAGYPVARITVTPAGTLGAARFSAAPVAQLDRNRELLVVHCDSTPLPRIPDQNSPRDSTLTRDADR